MWLYRKLRDLFVLRSMARGAEPLTFTLAKAFRYSVVYFFFVGLVIYFFLVPLVKGAKRTFTKGGVKEVFKYLWKGIKFWACWFVVLIVQIAQKVWDGFKSIKEKVSEYGKRHYKMATYLSICAGISLGTLAVFVSLTILYTSPLVNMIAQRTKQITVVEYRYNDREIIQPCPECGYSPYSAEYQAELEATSFQSQIVLSDYDRAQAEAIVCGEAGNQSFEGKKLVAQCLWDAWVTDGLNSIDEVRKQFGYEGYQSLDSWSGATEEQKEEVREAVRAIFDREEFVVKENILYFYSTGNGLRPNSWHETQHFVIWEGDHRFFSRWE